MSEVVRLRVPRRALLRHLPVLAWLVLFTIVAWVPFEGMRDVAGRRVTWSVAVLVFGGAFVLEWFRPVGVDLTDDAAVVRGRVRTRRIPWRDVQAVTFEESSVLLHRSHGRPVRLFWLGRRVTMTSQEWRESYGLRVHEWWAAHREPGWRLAPPQPMRPPAPVRPPPSVEDVWRTPPG